MRSSTRTCYSTSQSEASPSAMLRGIQGTHSPSKGLSARNCSAAKATIVKSALTSLHSWSSLFTSQMRSCNWRSRLTIQTAQGTLTRSKSHSDRSSLSLLIRRTSTSTARWITTRPRPKSTIWWSSILAIWIKVTIQILSWPNSTFNKSSQIYINWESD